MKMIEEKMSQTAIRRNINMTIHEEKDNAGRWDMTIKRN
jgi:hypothetical protein